MCERAHESGMRAAAERRRSSLGPNGRSGATMRGAMKGCAAGLRSRPALRPRGHPSSHDSTEPATGTRSVTVIHRPRSLTLPTNKPPSSSAPRAGSASASRANISSRGWRVIATARERRVEARSAGEKREGQPAHRTRRHRRHRRRRGAARNARGRKARSAVPRRRHLRLGAEAAARGLARRGRARVSDQCLFPDRRGGSLRGPAQARRHRRVHVVDARQHRATTTTARGKPTG